MDKLVTQSLKSDREDGLFPTVIVDEQGQCLGLVYSNEESIKVSLTRGVGVYWSRSRNQIWVKGETSGNTQELLSIGWDCDSDALKFVVRQRGQGKCMCYWPSLTDMWSGFCHLNTATCWGSHKGLSRLERTLMERKTHVTPGSYTQKLFEKPKMLEAKIMEEASELCEARTKEQIASEAADLLYFALAKCVDAGVRLSDVERDLDLKSMKVLRRPGEVKPKWATAVHRNEPESDAINGSEHDDAIQTNGTSTISSASPIDVSQKDASMNGGSHDPSPPQVREIRMRRYDAGKTKSDILKSVLQRPSQSSTEHIMSIARPIIQDVRINGDEAVLKYTHKFEKATSLKTTFLKAPFPEHMMKLSSETISAIDTSFNNIRTFHLAQKESKPLKVETMPGVVCSRFSRPIERVGLYVPGGTAVLPSTAMMLGVPAMVAGCRKIILASPPRRDGTVTPEIVYIAHKIGAEGVVLAGGAQAIAAMCVRDRNHQQSRQNPRSREPVRYGREDDGGERHHCLHQH